MRLTAKITVKLAKADYFAAKARKRLDTGKELIRACREINAVLNRGMEAWLMLNGLWRELLARERDVMKSDFSKSAPRILRHKVFSTYDKAYQHGDYLYYHKNPGDIPDKERADWIERVRGFLSDATRIIETIEKNTPGEQAFPEVHLPANHAGQWLIRTYKNASHEVHARVKVLSMGKHWLTIRERDRRIVTLDADTTSLKPAECSDDDPQLPFERRRMWFDLHPEYRQVPLYAGTSYCKSRPWYFTCPCCGYATLTLQTSSMTDDGDYNICPICDWADQYGQDDQDVDETMEGANWDYSLSEARHNFDQYGWMFRSGEKNTFTQHSHRALFDIRNEIRFILDAMVGETRPGKIYLLWCEIKRRWRKLDKALKQRELLIYPQDQQPSLEDLDEERRITSYTPQNHLASDIVGQWGKTHLDGIGKILWGGWGTHVMRFINGSIGTTRDPGETIDLPESDMYSPFEVRRAWFDLHPELILNRITCPCCAYPTINATKLSETCFLCGWQDQRDEGRQDDHNADEILGDQNFDYSLSEARRNFEEKFTMFRPGDLFWLSQGRRQSDFVARKKKIIGYFEALFIETDVSKIGSLWFKIQSEAKELADERSPGSHMSGL